MLQSFPLKQQTKNTNTHLYMPVIQHTHALSPSPSPYSLFLSLYAGTAHLALCPCCPPLCFTCSRRGGMGGVRNGCNFAPAALGTCLEAKLLIRNAENLHGNIFSLCLFLSGEIKLTSLLILPFWFWHTHTLYSASDLTPSLRAAIKPRTLQSGHCYPEAIAALTSLTACFHSCCS